MEALHQGELCNTSKLLQIKEKVTFRHWLTSVDVRVNGIQYQLVFSGCFGECFPSGSLIVTMPCSVSWPSRDLIG